MRREKHIDEMACAICGNSRICVGEGVEKCLLHPQMSWYAINAYREGYRKQSEGKWKFHEDGSGTCNQCGTTQKNVWDYDNWQNYCGHCGANMKGGE